jgi:hypothetical protein
MLSCVAGVRNAATTQMSGQIIEGKRPLEINMPRWEDNIKMDFKTFCLNLWSKLIWFKIRNIYGPLNFQVQ